MRLKYLVVSIVLLARSVSAPLARAGGIVSVCDQAHLLAALTGGGLENHGTVIVTNSTFHYAIALACPFF